MTNSEKVALMKGSVEDKKRLMEFFLGQLLNGVTLDEGDIGMLDFLKKDLLPKSQVVSLSATLAGVGGARS